MGVSMGFAMNKFNDCPIVCSFPETDKEWFKLYKAMEKLRIDSYPEKIHEFGSYLNEVEK